MPRQAWIDAPEALHSIIVRGIGQRDICKAGRYKAVVPVRGVFCYRSISARKGKKPGEEVGFHWIAFYDFMGVLPLPPPEWKG